MCFYSAMAKELSVLPESVMAGESFTATLTGVPVTGRTCVYSFKAATPFSVTCSATEGVFVLDVSAANSLILKAGSIYFAAFATTTTGGAVECVDSGYLLVEPNPLAVSNYAAAIAAVEAAILKYASNPNKRLQLDTMSIEYRSQEDLLSLLAYYRAEERRDLGGQGSGPIRVKSRFAW